MFLLVSSFTGGAKKVYDINGYAQGTSYHITYFAKSSLITKAEIESVFSNIDSSLSIYNPSSLISRFNESSTGIKADKHLLTVVRKSMAIFSETEGKFDITVYPLVNAWGFGNKSVSYLPDSASIKALLHCVGSNKISLQKGTIIKHSPCVKIDVNGIAQGYSVDLIANFLQKKGIRNYLVEIGGEIRVSGRKPNGESMKIGIEGPPENKQDKLIINRVISINKGAITTSGSYRKFVMDGSIKRSHLIDPKTGYPFENDMISVTVVAKDALTADGYDNPLMAMKVEEALNFVNNKKNLEAYFIYRKKDGAVADTASEGFRKYIVR
ncbi:FAD:protein FMN transferase [Pontibacter sp. 13R65]|uniref:FAD:protein FMN transferase n=1 Tax=Pontibacter sp. 13R65 TaxID=3127458 RepID=UPI00301BBCAF